MFKQLKNYYQRMLVYIITVSYAEKVNFYMKENQVLKAELEDTRTNLEINKEILFKQISSQLKDKDKKVLQSLKEENTKITLKNKELIKQKIELEKKIYKVQQELDDAIMKLQELQDRESSEIFINDNRLKEKESLIMQLKKELDKYYREDFNSTKELIICDPEKTNIEMYNELLETRELITKYNRLLQDEKRKTEQQEQKIQLLQQKLQTKKKKKKIKQNMENIELFGYILSSDESESTGTNNSANLDNIIALESPIIKFPEKIKQPKYLATDMSDHNQAVPKLDFSKVLSKYTPVKKIDIVEGIKMTNRSSDEYIDKLKFQLKYAKNIILNYKKKNHELKKLVVMLKQKCLTLKNSMNSCSTKDEAKNSKSVIGSKSENNPKSNNDSMDPNTSVRDDEYEESDFNYIIKEYNRSVCATVENK